VFLRYHLLGQGQNVAAVSTASLSFSPVFVCMRIAADHPTCCQSVYLSGVSWCAFIQLWTTLTCSAWWENRKIHRTGS